MVGRVRRAKRGRNLMGSHQRCWIWGRNVVLETLRAGRWLPLELRLADRLPAEQSATGGRLAAELGIPVVVEPADELTRRCRSPDHQGWLAKMPPYPYAAPEALLLAAEERNRPAMFIVLDALQDPYNFGAIVRSAEVLGADGVFVGESGQAEVSSLVARSSAGAVNYLPIARSPDLRALAQSLRSRGVQVVAATGEADRRLQDCDFRGPTAVVIGNEGTGIRPALLQESDARVRVPQSGRVGSLNAAVSAGIVLYEIRRQRTAG